MEETKLIALDLSLLSEEVIETLIEDATVEPQFFTELAGANIHRPKVLELLLRHNNTPATAKESIARMLRVPVPAGVIEEQVTGEERLYKKERERVETLLQRIQRMNVAERIQLALRGGKEIRNILLKDSNREVMLSVLENPKLTDTEIELIARSRNISDDALRIISKNREWMKNYSIVIALVTNPKTPPGISLNYMSSLKANDLRLLEKNRNVPEIIRSAAKRLTSGRRSM